jgi:predicted RNA-binding Zn-ribbon protein involved in translation (DUF1610 family)
MISQQHPRIALKSVASPTTERFVNAPPILNASSHTVDFTCDNCGAVLMHAEEGQVRGLLIHCIKCGTFNSTGG